MTHSLKRKAPNGAAVSSFRKIQRINGSAESSGSHEEEFAGFSDTELSARVAAAGISPGDATSAQNGARPILTANGLGKQAPAEVASRNEADLAQLQVDAVLEHVRPDETARESLHDFVAALQKVLTASTPLPPSPVGIATSAMRKRGVAVPFPDPQPGPEVQWKLAYQAPDTIRPVGSWPLDTACAWKGKDSWAVDLAVTMPKSLFQESDYKDMRYFHRRAYFVACLAAALLESPLGKLVDLTFACFNRDTRKPTLELRPKLSSRYSLEASRCYVRLLPVYDITDPPIKIARLLSSKDHSRPEQVGSQSVSVTSSNTAILVDGLIAQHHDFLEGVAQRSPHFTEACLLLKVWAHQRALGESYERRAESGLEDARFLLTMILAHLVSKGGKGAGRLPPRADAWQLFRGCIEFLGRGGLMGAALMMQKLDIVHETWHPDHSAHGRAVLVDPSRLVNLLARVPEAAIEYLTHLAKLTSRSLMANRSVALEEIFTRAKEAIHLEFDVSASVLLPSKWLVHRYTSSADFGRAITDLSRVVRRAVGSRAAAMSISTAALQPVRINQVRSNIDVLLGIGILATEAAHRLVDFGPPAEDVEAVEAFRAFWGEKSELRRFKDGTISEAVVWKAEVPSARGDIIGLILRYILCEATHLHLPPSTLTLYCNCYQGFLMDGARREQADFADVQAANEDLSRTLRDLVGLPLALSSVTASSEALRYTSVFVPASTGRATRLPIICSYRPIMDLHLTFEGSSRWPDDLEAVQKIKAALLVEIARKLNAVKSDQGIHRANMILDPNAAAQSDNAALEVLTGRGYSFRLKVHYEAEADLIRAEMLKARGGPHHDRYARMQATHVRTFVTRPRHHAAIASLQHRFSTFSGAVRLFKRWLGAHLLSPHLAAEAAELLVAHVFLSPGSSSVPASVDTAFVRTLHLLVRHPWRTSALLVPLYTFTGEDTSAEATVFPPQQEAQARRMFDHLRQGDTQSRRGALILATEKDLGGHEWTWRAPSRIVLSRLIDVAKAALSALDAGLRTRSLDAKILFSTTLDAYDFVIHLDPMQLPRYSQALLPDPAILRQASTSKATVLTGYDPAAVFLDRLQMLFGDTAILFHDLHGGALIAGVFDPALSKSREWRVHLTFPCQPVKNGLEPEAMAHQLVKLNRDAMMTEAKRLGGGLVQRTDTRY